MANTRSHRHPRERYGEVVYRNDGTEPHPQSPAALALLVTHLWRHDETVYRGDRWAEFKDKYLQDFAAKHGKVFCHWCQRDDMILKGTPEGGNEKNVVTLDHLIPTSRGGALYDPENVVPSCKRCNNLRAQMGQTERQYKKKARNAKKSRNLADIVRLEQEYKMA